MSCAAPSPIPRCEFGRARVRRLRELADEEFVTVILEAVEPLQVLAIPRTAILADQQGHYVYVVNDKNVAEQRRVKLGQSTPDTGAIVEGLKPGDSVIVEGIQRVRPNEVVARPASPTRPEMSSMISSAFIDRPRLAIVIAIVISLAGLLALSRIPVAQLPDIVPPQVQISAVYPGASAAVLEATVAQPIESKIIGVDKMIYMKSSSGNDGTYNLTVSFELGTDPDTNTVNVNNRVQTAMSSLPQEVQLQGLTVQKRSSSILQFIMLYSEGGKLDPLFITNYGIINVLDELSRTPGVGQASLFGRLNYSMRIWFDTARLTSLGLAPSDVIRRGAGAERSGAGRPHRRPAGSQGSAVPIQCADARPPDDTGAVRRHRHPR